MPKAERVMLLGLDAMVPNTLERFLAEGILPNLARLVERGSFTRVRPVIPAQTPTNWSTLATGATPGTHGVVQWGSHIPGDPVHEYHRREAFNAGLCRAEYLWEAAARHGLRSVVMNYSGYPPTTDSAVFIEWLFEPARSYFDLAGPTVYHNCPELDTSDPIELKVAEAWKNVPSSSLPPLEAELPVATATRGSGPTLHALLYARGEGYDSVLVAPVKDAAAGVAVNGWSEWMRGRFETEDQGEAEGAFRFKLLERTGDGRRLRLYRTDAFPADGRFCSDPALGKRLVEQLGPYVHSGQSTGLHCRGILDWQTLDELMAEEARWLSGAAELAMEATDAGVLVLHWHILDSMGHRFVPLVEPTATAYDPANLERHWDVIRNYYRAADRLVGAFLDRFDDGRTAFAVVSDHGMPGNKKAVSLVNLFKDRGWLACTEDGRGVDWTASKVFFSQNHLWINLRGRDEGGVVAPEEYTPLRAQVMAAMRDVKDPETGEHAFSFVLPREDAPMVGLWGDYIGDLAYCYAGGYRWSGPEVLKIGEERVVFPCGGGNHGPMIPTYETEATSVMGALLLAGPGICAGVRPPRQLQAAVCTTDVPTTLCHLLGIEPPAQSEGRVLREFLADSYTRAPARTLTPTARAIVPRPAVKPRAPRLQGDVTDEA